MALQSDEFEKAGERGYSLKLILTEESISVSSNTSLVSYEFYLVRTNYGFFASKVYNWNIKIGGNTIGISNFRFQISTDDPEEQLIKKGQVTVAHAYDGKKTMSFSVSTPNASDISNYAPKAMEMTGTWALTTIPRASTIYAIDANIGSSTLITISRASSSFTHTISYKFGDKSGFIATKTAKTSIPWSLTPAYDFYKRIPNAKYITVTLTCQTYSGSTLIGQTTTTFRANAPEATCKPTLKGSVGIVDETTLALTDGQAIRYISTIAATINCVAKNASTIARCTINGVEIPNPVSGKDFTIQFERAEAWHYLFEVWDSRGYYNSTYVDIDMHPYIPLTCAPQITRDEPTGDTVTVTCKGNFWNANFSASRANKLYLTVQYVEKGKSSWSTATEIPATVTDNTYRAAVKLSGLSYLNAYDFRIYAQDEAMHFTLTGTLSKGVPVFDWGEKDFRFNVPVEVMGAMKSDWCKVDAKGGWSSLSLQKNGVTMSGLTVNPDTGNLHILMYYGDSGHAERYVLNSPDKAISEDIVYYLLSTKNVQDYVVAQGSSGNWRWRKWNSGVAECWQRYSYETPAMVAVGGIFYSPKNVGGLAYPFEFIAKPTELVSCDGNIGGWYATAHDLPTNTTTETGYYHFFGARSRPAGYIAMNIYEIGRWK